MTNYVEKGYSVGDKAYIYGLECTVGEDGFLIFPQKIEYTDYRCKFFKDSAEKTWDELYPELDRTASPVPNITPETEVRQ